MTSTDTLSLFLDDLDETLETEGVVLVGSFVWILRGLGLRLDPLEMLDLSRQAYDIVLARDSPRLMWPDSPRDPMSSTTGLSGAAGQRMRPKNIPQIRRRHCRRELEL